MSFQRLNILSGLELVQIYKLFSKSIKITNRDLSFKIFFLSQFFVFLHSKIFDLQK